MPTGPHLSVKCEHSGLPSYVSKSAIGDQNWFVTSAPRTEGPPKWDVHSLLELFVVGLNLECRMCYVFMISFAQVRFKR